MVKEIGDEIRAQITSRKKATDAVLDEIRETKEHVRDLNERDDVAEGRDEDETQ